MVDLIKSGGSVVHNNATIMMTGNIYNVYLFYSFDDPVSVVLESYARPSLGRATSLAAKACFAGRFKKNCHYSCMYLVPVCPLD